MASEAITDPFSMFESLDGVMGQRGMCIDLVVCGGIVMKTVYKSTRDTHDIDSLTKFEWEMEEAISEVGGCFLGDEEQSHHWLNCDAVGFFSFDETLPKGWEVRAFREKAIYRGTNLGVYPLSRRDLILTKLFGFFGRYAIDAHKDVKDLKLMGVSTDEINDVLDDLADMMSGTSFGKSKTAIRSILNEIWSV